MTAEDGPVLQPCDRFDWERIVRRCQVHRDVKLVGFTMAQYGDKNGSRIRPGVQRLADVLGVSRRTIERHVGTLLALGLIERLSAGGGPSRAAAVYRLTVPVDLMERVELLGPDEESTRIVRQRRGGSSGGSTAAQGGGSSPVDNSERPPSRVAGDPNPSTTELPPSANELPPNPVVSPAIDPPVTCSDARHQGTTHLPPKTSPEVSTSPDVHSVDVRPRCPDCGHLISTGRHGFTCRTQTPQALRGAS